MTLGEYRKSHGMTQKALADCIEVGVSAVSRYEQGRIPAPEVMSRIVATTRGAVTPNDFHGLAAQ